MEATRRLIVPGQGVSSARPRGQPWLWERAVEPPEITDVKTTEVICEGSGGALGHPRVFLKIGQAGWVECPYCDRRFVLAPAPAR